MKLSSKKLLLFEIIVIIILLLNNFVSSILDGYIEVLFLGVLLLIFYYLFGWERDRHYLSKNVCLEIIIFLLIFFILYYLLGIVISFTRTNNYYHFSSLINIFIPMISIIIIKEILRYLTLTKAYDYKVLIVTSCILFILLDLVGKVKITASDSKFDIFVYIAIYVIPIISRNILCTFISYKVGYKPTILYLLVVELYAYLVPIIPNPNQYIYSIIWLIMPVILMYRLYIYFKKEKHDYVIEREYNKRKIGKLIMPIFLVIFLVYITSGYFHYHAIVVASGSMETSISKGDVVVIEKIDDKKKNDLPIKQVIAYRYNKIIVVHRIVKKIIVNDEAFYYTKGDANNAIDSYKVSKDMILGVVDVRIPYIGYPTIWIKEL